MKVKLVNGDVLTVPVVNGLYNWDSVWIFIK